MVAAALPQRSPGSVLQFRQPLTRFREADKEISLEAVSTA